MKNIDILYEDNSVIIINKPAGLAVQGGANIKTSLDKILASMRQPPPLLVHRLDKDTSGVLLAAKTKKAAKEISALFNSRNEKKTVKQYIAVCAAPTGCTSSLEGTAGVINLKLDIRGKSKESLTRYRLIDTVEFGGLHFSVLEIELGTGRMHQIRRHLAMTGCPILGDDKYGNFALNKRLRKEGLKHLLLHASRLIIKEINIDVIAPLPDYFPNKILLKGD